MNRIARAIAAASFGALATVAIGPAAAETKASAPVDTAAQAASEPKYCVMVDTTGSRIKRKVCATRAQWIEREGYDPLVDLK
ncbi:MULTISPECIES: hypothetical protein [unclassified Sphingomonas]|uniref:hypothetical protein n=1 Tax=unclassified Sphingomonas TaxID=196159 RepID=UPI00082B6759|nr:MULTISPECIES: hypothetical protein [unclassified Sphingomonas]MCH4892056.1 hypothetical protein [Sphingomonas sp. SFZ2018-12]